MTSNLFKHGRILIPPLWVSFPFNLSSRLRLRHSDHPSKRRCFGQINWITCLAKFTLRIMILQVEFIFVEADRRPRLLCSLPSLRLCHLSTRLLVEISAFAPLVSMEGLMHGSDRCCLVCLNVIIYVSLTDLSCPWLRESPSVFVIRFLRS